MKHNIIKTENYLLVVDDSEIKAGDFYLLIPENLVRLSRSGLPVNIREWAKIIAHLPLNNSPILEGVDLLPPLEDDFIELAKKYGISIGDKAGTSAFDFMRGYDKAKEKYKYTEQDLRKVWNAAYIDALAIDEETYKPLFFEDFIQSLQQPKYPIAFECEIEVYMHSINGDIVKPKTTTNSNGQIVWVGKYLH